MSRVLGIDYGDARVGIAISDELRMIATGLDNLVINGSDKNFIKGIRKLILEYDIKEVVIGYPRNMDGSNSAKTDKIDLLIPLIESLNVIVHKVDERLTTVSSYATMKELGISQKKKNIYADKLAATYILEMFLNRKK